MNRLLFALALAAPITLRAQAVYSCLAPTPGSEWVRSALNKTVRASDSATVAARAALQIPAGDSSIVQPVTDNVVCAQAAAAVATVFGGVQNSAGGWVFMLGSNRYYALDPNAIRAKRLYGVVLDQNFVVLSSDPIG